MSYLLSFSPFDLSKTFAFGVGIGVGIGMIFRKIKHEKQKKQEHLLSCLKHLAAEVRQLRETLLHSVASRISKDAIDGQQSSDDDEFFDPLILSEASIEEQKLFLEKIDKLQSGSSAEQQDAYNMLISRTNQEPTNNELLWRFAKSQYQISCLKEKAGDLEAQKFILEKGIQTGEAAVQADGSSSAAYKWYAILLGCNIQFMDNKKKIINGFRYKESIEKAIELNPGDAFCYYLLGRYCFEVFMLPWVMRKAATALFGEPPSATVDDALSNFLKCEEIQPGLCPENPLYIAKCYYQKWDYANTKVWLRKVIKSQLKDDNAEQVKIEALQLLKKCT